MAKQKRENAEHLAAMLATYKQTAQSAILELIDVYHHSELATQDHIKMVQNDVASAVAEHIFVQLRFKATQEGNPEQKEARSLLKWLSGGQRSIELAQDDFVAIFAKSGDFQFSVIKNLVRPIDAYGLRGHKNDDGYMVLKEDRSGMDQHVFDAKLNEFVDACIVKIWQASMKKGKIDRFFDHPAGRVGAAVAGIAMAGTAIYNSIEILWPEPQPPEPEAKQVQPAPSDAESGKPENLEALRKAIKDGPEPPIPPSPRR